MIFLFLVLYHMLFRYDESGKLLRHLIQQVEKAITLFEALPYDNDDKLAKLRTVHGELKNEYLETHLQRFDIILNVI